MTPFRASDEALAQIRQDVAAARNRAAKAQELKVQIDAVRGVGRSPRNEVAVEVDVSGILRDVQLTDAAMDLHPEDLSRLIIDAARAAQRQAGSLSVALAQDVFGEDSPLVTHLRTEVEQRYE